MPRDGEMGGENSDMRCPKESKCHPNGRGGRKEKMIGLARKRTAMKKKKSRKRKHHNLFWALSSKEEDHETG